MSVYQIIKQLESVSGRNDKIKILEQNKDNESLKTFFYLALDPMVTFGIKKIPAFVASSASSVSCITLEEAMTMLGKLASREKTGNAAIDWLTYILSDTTQETAELISRIIDKDPGCGVAESTVNKIWKGLIFDFPVMKASPHDERSFENISFPAYSQAKLDGCLSADWTVNTDHGAMTMEQISQNAGGLNVLSFNHSSGKCEFKKILSVSKQKTKKRWYTLTLADGTKTKPLTGNHEVWIHSEERYVRVDELNPGMFVMKN